MRSWVALCSLSVTLLGTATARAGFTTTVTTPYPGVTHTVYTDASVPLRVHVVDVDVTSQEIHLSATLSADRGQTVTNWANCARGTSGCTTSDVAINGDLVTPSGFVPAGLAIGGAKPWPDAAMDNAVEGWIAFGRPNDVNAVQLSAPANVEMPSMALAVEGAVGGRALLVQGGMPMSTYDAADPTAPFRSAPRTAVGLDQNQSTLYLVVVDGDQQSSLGMTAEELAWFLSGLGVSDALELDGGGSSTMYIRSEKGVVNSPSDGIERPVANQLGVNYGAQTHFSVVGFIFDKAVCDPGQPTCHPIANATVTVDGQLATWQNSHTLYHVDNITPHLVCARASAPGFISGVQCREITVQDVQSAGNIQYLSVVLMPGTDPPPDMARPSDMAMMRPPPPPRDFGVPSGGSDAGSTMTGKRGCALAAAGATPDADAQTGLVLVIVLFLGAAMMCRRRV